MSCVRMCQYRLQTAHVWLVVVVGLEKEDSCTSQLLCALTRKRLIVIESSQIVWQIDKIALETNAKTATGTWFTRPMIRSSEFQSTLACSHTRSKSIGPLGVSSYRCYCRDDYNNNNKLIGCYTERKQTNQAIYHLWTCNDDGTRQTTLAEGLWGLIVWEQIDYIS